MTDATIPAGATFTVKVNMPPTDRELIDELRKRGYRVFNNKRCRIYGAETAICYREIEQRRHMSELMERIQQRIGADIGVEIFRAGACVRSTQDELDRRIFRSSVMVVLPNDFDFEREMWEVRS